MSKLVSILGARLFSSRSLKECEGRLLSLGDRGVQTLPRMSRYLFYDGLAIGFPILRVFKSMGGRNTLITFLATTGSRPMLFPLFPSLQIASITNMVLQVVLAKGYGLLYSRVGTIHALRVGDTKLPSIVSVVVVSVRLSISYMRGVGLVFLHGNET